MPPVGAFLAAAATSIGAAATAAGTFLASTAIGQAVGSIALSLGLSYVQSILNRPKQQKPSDGQQEYRQAIPNRTWVYGRMKVSGAYAFWESRNSSAYKVVLLSSRGIDAVERIYLDDMPVDRRADGGVTSKPTFDADGKSQGPNVWVDVFLGQEDQAASQRLMDAFPGEWTADHRLRGAAYLVQQSRSVDPEAFNKYFPNGEPKISALIRGVGMFDPRDGVSRWSDNAALAVLDYLLASDGYDHAPERIEFGSFRTYADLCDQIVNGQKRYRIATIVDLTEPRKQVLQRLLEACDAQLFTTTDGKIAIRGGQWEEPTVFIDYDEGHIIEASWGSPDAMDRYNELAIQYLDPDLDFVENEAASWQDPISVATGKLVTQPLELFQVPSQSQARRLAKIRMARDNSRWTGELVTNLAGLNCIGERIVRIRFPELSIDAPFWIESLELSPDLTTVNLKVRSASQASYDWSPAEEGTSTVIPPDTTPVLDLSPPVLTLAEASGPRVVATWTPSQALNREYAVRIRPASQPNAWSMMTVASTRDQATSDVLAGGQAYVVQIKVSAGPQAQGNWSADYNITVTGTVTMPAPEAFDSLLDGSNVLLSWRNPNTPTFRAAHIYRAAGAGAAFSSSADLLGPIYGSPNQVMTITDAPGTGTWRYWVTAERTESLMSAPVGPETVVVP
jgi:hypothetical protein